MERAIAFPAGSNTLEGLISVPQGSPRAGVVICHPHPLRGGEMSNAIVEALVGAFGDAGHATLRFNFRGVGASTGVHDEGRGEIDDVRSAVTCLLARSAVPIVAVAGYSFGAWVGLAAGVADPRVHRLIGIAPPVASRDHGFLAGAAKPTLLIAGDCDDYAPVAKLSALAAGLGDQPSLVIVAGADHFFGSAAHEVSRSAAEFVAGA